MAAIGEPQITGGKRGSYRVEKVDMLWIWSVYSFGDKLRDIALMHALVNLLTVQKDFSQAWLIDHGREANCPLILGMGRVIS